MTVIIVTAHALARARQRYGLVNIDRDVIFDDVRSALLSGRGGRNHPNGSGFSITGGAIYVWTACKQRVYVVEAKRRRLLVVTAIPGVYGGEHLPDAYRRRLAA